MFTRGRGRKQRDFSAEIASHIEMEADRLRAAGLSDSEAYHSARRTFGNITAVEERFFESRRWRWWDELKTDFRYARRTLWRSPGFAIAAALTLALGIGANTAIFSVVDAVALRSLPYPDAARIFVIYGREPGGATSTPSPAWFLDFRRDCHSFENVAGYRSSALNLVAEDQAERIEGAVVTPDFFAVMGVHAQLGRTLNPSADAPGRPRAVVLSDSLWRRRYSADPAIVGHAIDLDGESYTVAGVMPASFQYPPNSDVWLPARYAVPEHALRPDLDQSNIRDSHYFFAVGRLRPGVSKTSAQAEADLVAMRLRRAHPEGDLVERAALVTLNEELFGEAQSPVAVLLAAVGLLLLIACANVANLVLARGAARTKEIAIRAALGASRRRLVRQLVTESLLLASGGCTFGIALAYAALQPVTSLLPLDVSATKLHIDVRVLAFAATVSASAGLLCGLFPALALAKAGPGMVLNETARGSSGGPGSGRTRNLLVVAEVALTAVLLAGGGLLVRSMQRLERVPTGFAPERVMSARISLPQIRYPTPEDRARFVAQVLDRLNTSPGIASAGVVSRLPLLPGNSTRSVEIKGRPSKDTDLAPDYLVASPAYFRSMGIRLIRGRMFTERDGLNSPPVVLINASMARYFWGTHDPIGQFVQAGACGKANEWCEVVGIVEDVRQHNLAETPRLAMYVPYARDPWPFLVMVARSAADPAAAASTVTGAVHAVDKDQAVFEVRTLTNVLERSLGPRRTRAWFVAAFAGLALALACIGIYGVASYNATQRAHEIGIRIALGAARADVLRLVIGQAIQLAGIGAVAGLMLAAALGRLISSMLFEIRPTDAATFAVCVAILLSVAALASYIPARRASRADPAVSLRAE